MTRKLLYLLATVVFSLACVLQPVRANPPLASMSDDYYMRHRITPFALRADLRRPYTEATK